MYLCDLRARVQRPTRCYTWGILALFALALAPALTVWQLWQPLPVPSVWETTQPPLQTLDNYPLVQTINPRWMHPVLPRLGMLWLGGVVLLSMNSWCHWRRMHWLLRHAAAPVPGWQYPLQRLCDLAARALIAIQHVVTPTLVGWLKLVILLPASVLSGFTPQQIEMIIAHELGHVRRWDYLLNLFQVALETMLFYHPAVHWISREVRNIRETCCGSRDRTGWW